jgi:hypothetical protein
MRRHPRRARVDPTSPQAWATSDRSGAIGNHEDLCYQYAWRGTQLVNTRLLVYADELDVPNRQLGTIILPPDPVPILNARPEQYAIDEQTYRITMDGTQRYLMDGTARLEANLQGNPNAGYTPG